MSYLRSMVKIEDHLLDESTRVHQLSTEPVAEATSLIIALLPLRLREVSDDRLSPIYVCAGPPRAPSSPKIINPGHGGEMRSSSSNRRRFFDQPEQKNHLSHIARLHSFALVPRTDGWMRVFIWTSGAHLVVSEETQNTIGRMSIQYEQVPHFISRTLDNATRVSFIQFSYFS
jgi:hypothetical protein